MDKRLARSLSSRFCSEISRNNSAPLTKFPVRSKTGKAVTSKVITSPFFLFITVSDVIEAVRSSNTCLNSGHEVGFTELWMISKWEAPMTSFLE